MFVLKYLDCLFDSCSPIFLGKLYNELITVHIKVNSVFHRNYLLSGFRLFNIIIANYNDSQKRLLSSYCITNAECRLTNQVVIQ